MVFMKHTLFFFNYTSWNFDIRHEFFEYTTFLVHKMCGEKSIHTTDIIRYIERSTQIWKLS